MAVITRQLVEFFYIRPTILLVIGCRDVASICFGSPHFAEIVKTVAERFFEFSDMSAVRQLGLLSAYLGEEYFVVVIVVQNLVESDTLTSIMLIFCVFRLKTFIPLIKPN